MQLLQSGSPTSDVRRSSNYYYLTGSNAPFIHYTLLFSSVSVQESMCIYHDVSMQTPVSLECLSKVGGGYIGKQVVAGRCHETHKSWVLKFNV